MYLVGDIRKLAEAVCEGTCGHVLLLLLQCLMVQELRPLLRRGVVPVAHLDGAACAGTMS
jgi:hypothetical protein